jgi:hypothetical protein
MKSTLDALMPLEFEESSYDLTKESFKKMRNLIYSHSKAVF